MVPNQRLPAFPDSNLEAVIREAISKPEGPIYTSNLESLTHLTAQGRGISNLTGLQYCANLTMLYLWDNQISDISSLASLTNLTDLRLFNNQISDISPLASLTNLTTLCLGANQISDISALASLINLIHLELLHNQIQDIEPLVANSGLSRGDEVFLAVNPLNTTSVDVYIPELKGRGITVAWYR